MPGAAIQRFRAKLVTGQFIAPISESAFGELHDIAFVDQGDAAAVVVDGILHRLPHQPFGAEFADGLNANR